MVVIALLAIIPVIGTICEGIQSIAPDKTRITKAIAVPTVIEMADTLKESGIPELVL